MLEGKGVQVRALLLSVVRGFELAYTDIDITITSPLSLSITCSTMKVILTVPDDEHPVAKWDLDTQLR